MEMNMKRDWKGQIGGKRGAKIQNTKTEGEINRREDRARDRWLVALAEEVRRIVIPRRR